MATLGALAGDVKQLIKERNFYYRKLSRIEEFAGTLPGASKARLLKLLQQKGD